MGVGRLGLRVLEVGGVGVGGWGCGRWRLGVWVLEVGGVGVGRL